MGVLAMYLIYKFHLLGRYVFIKVQSFFWRINGVGSCLDRIWNGDQYERSAHVLDILWRFKPMPSYANCIENFTTTHRNFTHPNVIRSDAVSLMCVTGNEAIFVEVPPDIDLYSCSKYPLIFRHQYDFAIRLIRMPISSFHRISQAIGDPDDKEVIMVHYTERCGSTLLVQLLERLRLGKTSAKPSVSFSECTSFEPIFSNRSEYNELEFLEILRSSFRVICKYETPLVIIKAFLGTWIRLVPEVSTLFPRFHQLFADRASLPQITSRLRVTDQVVEFRLLHFAQSHPTAARWLNLPREQLLRHYYGELYEQLKHGEALVKLTRFETLSLSTLALKKTYVDYYKRGNRIAAVRLEDIEQNPHAALHQVLAYCKLENHMDQIPVMMKALERDSHANNPNRLCKKSRGVQSRPRDTVQVARCDELCDRFGLFRLSDPSRLPGTISSIPVSPKDS